MHFGKTSWHWRAESSLFADHSLTQPDKNQPLKFCLGNVLCGGTHALSPPSNRSGIRLETQTDQKTNSRSQNYRRFKCTFVCSSSFLPAPLLLLFLFVEWGGVQHSHEEWDQQKWSGFILRWPDNCRLLRPPLIYRRQFISGPLPLSWKLPSQFASRIVLLALFRSLSLHYFSASSSSRSPCFAATFLCATAPSLWICPWISEPKLTLLKKGKPAIFEASLNVRSADLVQAWVGARGVSWQSES